MREMINLYQFLSLWVSTCMLKLLSRWLMDKTWYFRHLTTARQWVYSLLHKNSTYIEAVSQVRTADILGTAAWVKQRDERRKLKREKKTESFPTWISAFSFIRLLTLLSTSHCPVPSSHIHQNKGEKQWKLCRSHLSSHEAQSSISSLSLHRCCAAVGHVKVLSKR